VIRIDSAKQEYGAMEANRANTRGAGWGQVDYTGSGFFLEWQFLPFNVELQNKKNPRES
jgi:hypothetical protein